MPKKSQKLPKHRSVTIRAKYYGKAFLGTKIYYEGKRPKSLKADGGIKFGKHVLEAVKRKFGKNFMFVITKKTDSVERVRDTVVFRLSAASLERMNKLAFDRERDLKLEIVASVLSSAFPEHFKSAAHSYVPGTLAAVLQKASVGDLSDADRAEVQNKLPDFIAAESIASVNLLKAKAQIESLREVETEMREAMEAGHTETWWQKYIKKRILLIQQGYIQTVEKANVAVGNTKFPDFLLVTHDGYLDVLEIKRPGTPLLKLDASRGNWYWTPDLSSAVSQAENYLVAVDGQRTQIRTYLKDEKNIEVQVLRPRAIVLAGSASEFTTVKQRNDFHLLSQGLKNVTVVTYDEMLARLSNYIHVLESHIAS